jgi:hypothetical protein
VDFVDAPEFLDGAIGDADPVFIDSHDLYTKSGRASSYEDFDEEDSDDDYCFTTNASNLEELLWIHELLHNPRNLQRLKERQIRRGKHHVGYHSKEEGMAEASNVEVLAMGGSGIEAMGGSGSSSTVGSKVFGLR